MCLKTSKKNVRFLAADIFVQRHCDNSVYMKQWKFVVRKVAVRGLVV